MSTQELKKVSIIPQDEPRALAPVNPMEMLSRAVESGADIEMIEKLMGLQERWETSQARKAFDEAVAAAKAEIPPIERNASGHNDKRYANFAAIAKVVDPIASGRRRMIGSASPVSYLTRQGTARKRRSAARLTVRATRTPSRPSARR